MEKTLFHPKTDKIIKAIASKSEVHRLLICSALADSDTDIVCEKTNVDIDATANCLRALGADINYENGVFHVKPISNPTTNAKLPCEESGSTLRFLLPLVCCLCDSATFETKGRLSQRPLSPLKEELERSGAEIVNSDSIIKTKGKCIETNYTIAGNVSSQFISGLLFMLTLTGGTINVTGDIESLPYIEMTIDALSKFGCKVIMDNNTFIVNKTNPLVSPKKISSCGDWSNGAFFLAAGIIGEQPISISGLYMDSRQGDKAIVDILKNFGGKIEIDNNIITAYPSKLNAINIDAKNIPDLVPILSIVATAAKGITKIYNCSRLRIKESDRIESVYRMIKALGGKITIDNDDIIIEGSKLSGGTVDSYNDHRIAMSSAIASFYSTDKITITNANAVNKSYPSFWDEIKN